MIELEKIKQEKCPHAPPPPLPPPLRRLAPEPYCHTSFLSFQIPLPPNRGLRLCRHTNFQPYIIQGLFGKTCNMKNIPHHWFTPLQTHIEQLHNYRLVFNAEVNRKFLSTLKNIWILQQQHLKNVKMHFFFFIL